MRDNHTYEVEIGQILEPETGNRSVGFPVVVVVAAIALLAGAFFLVRTGKNNPLSDRADLPKTSSPAFARREVHQKEEVSVLAPSTNPTRATTEASEAAPPPPTPRPDIEINEIMSGSALGGDDEFIELWNGSDLDADLSGWAIKKRSAGGAETTFVSSGRFSGIRIPPRSYLLLGNDGGYRGNVLPEVRWPHSTTFAYKKNALLLYDGTGALVDEVEWEEIPPGASAERDAGGIFALTDAPSPGRGVRR